MSMMNFDKIYIYIDFTKYFNYASKHVIRLQQNTDKDAVISGSMQLMAGVKLCSDRTVTNHPHFEDLDLRMRTKELYQMYAKTSPSQVYDLLVKYRANFIILEDSICLAHRERCGLPDIMDLTNGHVGL